MRRSESLFARATRHVISQNGVDPREDRLTEVTAAVLERVPGLARWLALSWLHPSEAAVGETARAGTDKAYAAINGLPRTADVRVRTQVVLPDRRVDLEIRFLDPDTRSTEAVVWVENKHGTSPHTEQLLAYVTARPRDRPSAVVLLAPRDALPAGEDQASPEAPERTWQRTAARARGFRPDKAEERFVRDEWLTCLYEEG